MTLIVAWICASIVIGFTAGWVVGHYGHSAPKEVDPEKLLAFHLAHSNRRNLQ